MGRSSYISRRFSVFLTLVAVSPSVWADTLQMTPKLSHVTVFTHHAMIERGGKVSLKKGENTILIPSLSPRLMEPSVQVKIGGDASVKIADVTIESTYLNANKTEQVEKLQAKLDQIMRTLRSKHNDISIITHTNDFLKRTHPFAQNQKISAGEITAHATFLEKSFAENYSRISLIESETKKLEGEKERIENELNTLRSPEQTKQLRITLTSSVEIPEAPLELSYTVDQVSWRPVYTLYADSVAGTVQWTSFASISQNSGEEWRETPIEISTARPFASEAPGPLSGWYLDLYRPVPAPSKAVLLSYDMMEKGSGSIVPESYSAPEIESQTTSFSFHLPGSHTIASDNRSHKLFIASQTKEAKLHYRALPKISPYAYLMAIFPNPFPFPLLSGELNVICDGKMVGARPLKATVFPDEEIHLSLGIDESIKITHQQRKKQTEEKTFISNEIKTFYAFTHEIVNGKNKPIHIRIEDRIPISRHEQIEVVVHHPKKESVNLTDEGIVTWDLNLKAKETKTLPVEFTLTYPRNIRIEGLE